MRPTSSVREAGALQPSFGRRQMSMIALGGVIGAGLFVGSGSAIRSAGPGVVLGYIAVGALVVLMMRMLAELAVASPDTGSFALYATREIGAWAGLAVGWIYIYMWAITVGFEATAAAAIVHRHMTGLPAWLVALVIVVTLTGANLITARSFGELEFWFASIKVSAIVAFLVLGVVAIFGWIPGHSAPGLTNLTGHGGFLPHGAGAVLLAILAIMFSFFGTEVVTVAAGEAKDPQQAVRTAMRTVVARILVFYIGSVAVIVTLMPTDSSDVTASPFVAVLAHLEVPLAAQVMDVVVLTAVLSCLNSGIYTCSRMLFSLAQRGEAPTALARTNRRGVPVPAVFAASVGGFITVVANYFLPTATVFTFLLESTGALALVVYVAIAVTQLRGRFRVRQEGHEKDLPVRMWGYPVVTWAVLVLLVVIAFALALNPETRRSTFLSVVVTAVAVTTGLLYQNRLTKKSASKP
ncbi:amino acid permease [Nocardia beijingensis]|uniref:amino acid permease n=1 Tax=Nocardia beijingensis TaxID=95162 RepID=UPI00189512EF|nr:amino acid permease [Nocardia beijingensis]MBF6469996.1 amino acid permease [Nocardia beijingensis]